MSNIPARASRQQQYVDTTDVDDVPDSYYDTRLPTSAIRYRDARGNQVIQRGNKRVIIHLYVVREQERRPYTAFPLFQAICCLLGILAVTVYSVQHPYYEHERLTVPAEFLPLKVFTAETPSIPTGTKTYPATYAHGYLTFSNGSVIGQSVPAGFTIDNVSTNYAVYVPPATASGLGVARVPAHLLVAGAHLSTLAINEVLAHPCSFVTSRLLPAVTQPIRWNL